MKKIKVCIIDDSALMRQVLSTIIESDPKLEIIFTASDPVFAEEKLKKDWPDVIILDVEMPRMDGISFLKKIMAERPTPVIICSTLTEKNSPVFHKALENGAVEVITKPTVGLKTFLSDSAQVFLDTIYAASHVDISKYQKQLTKKNPEFKKEISTVSMTEKIVAIGTSTGGTIALEYILSNLEFNAPGMVIVQHMPEKFTASFADRLNSICKIEVREAKDRDRILSGLALIAPGNKHMSVKKSGAQYYVEISDGPLVSRHRPSVDVLFRSVAKNVGLNSVGIIMTGMGDDGASGLKEIKDSGGYTVAQDEESCIVFGMPKEAIKRNAVEKIMPLSDIPNLIYRYRTK